MNWSKIRQIAGNVLGTLHLLIYILQFHPIHAQQISAKLQPCLDLLNEGEYVAAYPVCMDIQVSIMDDKKMPAEAVMNGLMEVSNRYLQGGYVLDALTFNELSVEFGRTHFSNTELYYEHLLNLFGLSISNGRYDILLPAGTELALLSQQLYGHSDELLPYIYLQLGVAHLTKGEYAESSDSFRKGGNIRAIQAGGQDSLCGGFLIRQAEVQHLLGNYNQSIQLLDEALSIYQQLQLNDAMYLADCRNLRMLTYSQGGQYELMFEEINQLLPLLEDIELKDKLNHFTNMMIVLTDYDATFGTRITFEAGLDTIAYEMLEVAKTADIDPQVLSNAYLNLGNSFLLQQDFANVYKYYQEATNILESSTGKDGNYITLRNTIAIAAEKLGNISEAAAIYAENRVLLENILLNNYAFLPEDAQLSLIQSFEFTYDCIISFGIRHGAEFPQLQVNAASINLLFQGIVLRNTTGIRNRMLQSGKPDDQQLIEQWLNLKKEAAAIYFSDPLTAESLLQQAAVMEADFSLYLKHELTGKDSFDWEKLRNNLSDNTAGVQFLRVRPEGYFMTNEAVYYACVTVKDFEQPQWVYLCRESELQSLLSTQPNESARDRVMRLYNWPDPAFPEDTIYAMGNKLYQLTWGPLSEILTGIDTVHFSVSGLLHRISMSAIPLSFQERVLDHYTCKQTQQLLYNNITFQPYSSISIFGGLQYEPGKVELKTDSLLADRGDSWRMLPGTLAEAKSLQEKAKSMSMKVQLYTGMEADEQRIYRNNLLSADIVHLGTHGFFLTPDTSIHFESPGALFYNSPQPMQRCGLLLSNANVGWKNGTPSSSDGILTAAEIANLNLTSTKLVVLSACETGLGDLVGDEGVYGLQRAFFMAGAKSVVMSLWKVPDMYTSRLMELFYTQLFSGSPPADALRKAQKELSKQTDPYNWAAFILVE